ncbi:hypothetical protein ACOME3_005366 [Neoechinorhynchus agilis]
MKNYYCCIANNCSIDNNGDCSVYCRSNYDCRGIAVQYYFESYQRVLTSNVISAVVLMFGTLFYKFRPRKAERAGQQIITERNVSYHPDAIDQQVEESEVQERSEGISRIEYLMSMWIRDSTVGLATESTNIDEGEEDENTGDEIDENSPYDDDRAYSF